MRKLLCLILFSLAGCAGNLPGKPDPALAEKRPDQIRDFQTLYSRNCAGCHGKNGKLGPAPPLQDAFFLAMISDEELRMILRDGHPGTPMPAFAKNKSGPLLDEQIEILVRGLRNTWGSSKVTAAGFSYAFTRHEDVDLGKKVYARACAGCHGDQGQGGMMEGNPVGALREAALLSLLSDQTLHRLIVTGRPDLGMPDYKDRKGRAKDYAPLTKEEAAALVQYLGSWRQSAGGNP